MATTQLVVTAPLVIAKNDVGSDVYLYEGAPVSGQSDDWIERHQRDGMIGEREVADAPATDDGSSSTTGDFDAAAFVDRAAADVTADAGDLSDEDRAAALDAERSGENRITVVRALGGE